MRGTEHARVARRVRDAWGNLRLHGARREGERGNCEALWPSDGVES